MEIKHPNFISNNKVFCVRCQICGKENYALAVASGICVWCGEDHNKLREESIKPYILKKSNLGIKEDGVEMKIVEMNIKKVK